MSNDAREQVYGSDQRPRLLSMSIGRFHTRPFFRNSVPHVGKWGVWYRMKTGEEGWTLLDGARDEFGTKAEAEESVAHWRRSRYAGMRYEARAVKAGDPPYVRSGTW